MQATATVDCHKDESKKVRKFPQLCNSGMTEYKDVFVGYISC